MEKPVTINMIEVENTKRIRAVSCHLAATGLTVVGGKNRNGKTTFLDAVAWTLGGERFRPSAPNNTAGGQARTRVELSNGLIVERKGKNGTLTVTDPSGAKSGQSILTEVIPLLALDLPKFLGASDKEKAKILLGILGVEKELQALEEAEKALYSEREALGRQAKKAAAYAEELPFHEDAPEALVSAQELIKAQQAVLLRNAENQKERGKGAEFKKTLNSVRNDLARNNKAIKEAEEKIAQLKLDIKHLQLPLKEWEQVAEHTEDKIVCAEKTAAELQDESTAELETQLADVETANAKFRANAEKAKARKAAEAQEREYAEFGGRIGETRTEITALLEGAELPLPELTVRGGELEYRCQKWDNMSGSEHLKVAAAIVRKLNPACGFILVDKLEQMDLQTLKEFGAWAEAEGLQIIGTRVSTGSECTLIIEDGELVGPATDTPDTTSIESDFALCPIAGGYYGRPWAGMEPEILQWALDNSDDAPELTARHLAAIRAVLETR